MPQFQRSADQGQNAPQPAGETTPNTAADVQRSGESCGPEIARLLEFEDPDLDRDDLVDDEDPWDEDFDFDAEDSVSPNEVGDVSACSSASGSGSGPESGPGTPWQIAQNVMKRPQSRCFVDQFGFPYLGVLVSKPTEHFETIPLSRRSKRAREWIRSTIQESPNGIPPSPRLIDEIILYLEEASEATQIPLASRVTKTGEEMFVDLGDDSWHEVRISANGWSVQQNEGPRFRRHRHQRPLPVPEATGDIQGLRRFFTGLEQSAWLVLLAWLIAAMDSAIIKPLLMLIGPPGSAKSTRSYMLRSLLDPSISGCLGDVDQRSLLHVLFRHAVPCFDNLGHFSRGQSDLFCRAITGTDIEHRRLFTDMDEIIFGFRRPMILNGIHVPTTRADFLDRCVILRMDRFPLFGSETQIKADFENQWPQLFGGLLNLVSSTLRLLPTVERSSEFRMVDFVRYGRAVAAALHRNPIEFDNAYRLLQADHIDAALSDEPLALAILRRLADDPLPLEGTAQELLERLTAFANRNDIKIGTRGKGWPKSSRWFSTRLDELTPLLISKGVIIERLPRTAHARRLKIHKAT